MKILIITYSREVNPGTFLQAYGVQYAMKQLYPNAQIDLLKHKRLYSLSGRQRGCPSNVKKKDWNWLKGKLLAIPRRMKYEWNYALKFHFSEQEFDLFDYDETKFKKFAERYDLIVVGSDTILIELKRNNHFGLMWLLNVNTNKVLFAASAAPANYEISENDADILKKSFSTFKLLSVRDSVTYSLMSERIGLKKEIMKVFDPTYLIPSNEFRLPYWVGRKLCSISKKQRIALVNFGGPFEQKKAITEYLKSRGFYTIATHYNQWVDMNIMTLSPFEWAAMFKFIDLTVTERFHDSVFTLRNNKPVVAVDWDDSRFTSGGSSKTKDILQCYGMDLFHKVFHKGEGFEKIKDQIDWAIDNFDIYKCKDLNLFVKNECNKLLSLMKALDGAD